MFYSLHPNGTFDRHALHGGCPVVTGEKFVATKWIRGQVLWQLPPTLVTLVER